MENPETFETGCCPRFDPGPWDDKEVAFENKLFLKDHVKCFLHIPLNFGAVVKRAMEKIEKAGALPKEQLMLTDESLWGMDIYVAIDKEVPGETMERITGTFMSKVFEGPYSKVGQFVKEMKGNVKAKGKQFSKLFFYYAYCPKCAKAYGKNYIAILAQI